MLIHLLISITITMTTVVIMLVSKFHSYNHRLLTLVIGLVAVYEFYLIVEYLTGATEVFKLLKDLMLIQFLVLLVYYLIDYLEFSPKPWIHWALFGPLLIMDIYACVMTSLGRSTRSAMLIYSMAVSLIIIIVPLITLTKRKYSKKTRQHHAYIFTIVFIPAIALFHSLINLIHEPVSMPIALNISCILLDYLFLSGKLRDVRATLIEELFHTTETPTLVFDSDLYYLDASSAAKELLPELVAELSNDPKDYPKLSEYSNQIKENKTTEIEINGRTYSTEFQEAEYKGRMIGYFLVFSDVTAHKEEAEMARSLAKERSNFLASMSHDLRSPLHAIIGGSEILMGRPEMSSRSQHMVANIHEAGENLLDMVNSILDFSKLESGNLTLHRRTYSFKRLLENQARNGMMNLRGKDVALTVEVTTPFPDEVYGDELHIRQIIQNLLSNAIKFTDSGSIGVTVAVKKIRTTDKGRDYYEFTLKVRDSGIGMTPEQIEKVFDGYVSYAANVNKEGTGLGLSIVKRLSELMDGTTYAESDGKTGSTFTSVFCQESSVSDTAMHAPMIISDYVNETAADIPALTVRPNYIYPEANVLVVDDMKVNRELFREMTAPWRFKLTTASDGCEVADLLRKRAEEGKPDFDLIFLDQMMPVLSGLETSDQIEGLTKAVKILLSANIDDSLRQESKKHGFTDFLAKPIDLPQLSRMFDGYIPKSLRRNPDVSAGIVQDTQSEMYYRSLKTYVSELKSLEEPIKDYAENDIDMFRNKTHGIKGISKQLGKNQIAFISEIMEMAAKTDNRAFIKANLDALLSELEIAISSGEKELDELASKLGIQTTVGVPEEADDIEVDIDTVKELFTSLRDALDSYEMTDIDNAIEALRGTTLNRELCELLNKAEEMYNNVDYDEAAELISSTLLS